MSTCSHIFPAIASPSWPSIADVRHKVDSSNYSLIANISDGTETQTTILYNQANCVHFISILKRQYLLELNAEVALFCLCSIYLKG